MAADGFEWIIAPEDELIPNIEEYGRKLIVAVHAVAARWGAEIQNAARKDAPWNRGRTGAAVSGLFFAVDGFGMQPIVGELDKAKVDPKSLMDDVEVIGGDDETLIIALSHTVYYGKFLELSNGGRYAIIMSTIESHLPMLERMIGNIKV